MKSERSDDGRWEYGNGDGVTWEYGNEMGDDVTWEHGNGTQSGVTWGYWNGLGGGVSGDGVTVKGDFGDVMGTSGGRKGCDVQWWGCEYSRYTVEGEGGLLSGVRVSGDGRSVDSRESALSHSGEQLQAEGGKKRGEASIKALMRTVEPSEQPIPWLLYSTTCEEWRA